MVSRIVHIGECTLYCGDCLGVLQEVPEVNLCLTDPVWPNCPEGSVPGADGYQDQLLGDALRIVNAKTLAIILGFDSDPRFLSCVPYSYKFIRSQQLPYAFPGYRGRLLAGDEVCYIYGEIPKGTGTIPGRARTKTSSKASTANGHPFPRQEVHMECLVGWWSPEGGSVLDPFMGSGTTGVACVHAGRSFTGIEIVPEYFEISCKRIEQAYAQQRLFA
jgi:site-specific DNA-methyltransferase (adenine-specific)